MALVSVPELVQTYLLGQITVTDAAPGGVIVGGIEKATNLADGVVVIADSGQAGQERYLPLHRARVEIRTAAKTIARADEIANAVFPVFETASNVVGRTEMLQPSTGETFLVHTMDVTGGPSLAHDPDTQAWFKLLFIELYIGTEAIP